MKFLVSCVTFVLISTSIFANNFVQQRVVRQVVVQDNCAVQQVVNPQQFVQQRVVRTVQVPVRTVNRFQRVVVPQRVVVRNRGFRFRSNRFVRSGFGNDVIILRDRSRFALDLPFFSLRLR